MKIGRIMTIIYVLLLLTAIIYGATSLSNSNLNDAQKEIINNSQEKYDELAVKAIDSQRWANAYNDFIKIRERVFNGNLTQTEAMIKKINTALDEK